jgi:hypothetical protein
MKEDPPVIHIPRATLYLPALALTAIGLAMLPPSTVVASIGLGVVVGVLTSATTSFLGGGVRGAMRAGALATGLTTGVAVTLVSLVSALGAASVIAIPALYAVAALSWWALSRARMRPAPSRPRW